MATRKRLSPEESRTAALEAARNLLIEAGPQSVTLKAVAARVGRTHANLLHHFGSASGLQKALARHLAQTVCQTIAEAVRATRAGVG
ncbi:MAG: helix-turn-helix transcriptional regulator, partial [Betaproteobacteria bacterium]|nr:helix-turn-helix transcriptional regulator [Betaproteobacteria bacterium]